MNFTGGSAIYWKIARRYVLKQGLFMLLLLGPILIILWPFRKLKPFKSLFQFNAIQLITGISTLGLAVGTASLILVLSVFNGFESLIRGLFAQFNPDIKVLPVKGKYFDEDTLVINKILQIPGVSAVSRTIEEVAFFEYDNAQDFGTIKGVDDQFALINRIDSSVVEGQYNVTDLDDGGAWVVMGGGLRNRLSVRVDDYFKTISVFMPRRERPGPFEQPFKQQILYPAGTFLIQQEFDEKYMLTSLGFVRDLLDAPESLSALEIKIKPAADMRGVSDQIQALVGADYKVLDRYRQDAAFIKLLNIEKWLSFSILLLTIVLVLFNLVGCLWMIVLDKRKDLSILQALGASSKDIFGLVFRISAIVCFLGVSLGFLIATALYIYHKQYGLITIPQGFVVTTYPAQLRLIDFWLVGGAVCLMALPAALPAALRARKISASGRAEG
jgi:lipoprotein-releasing system permease protein